MTPPGSGLQAGLKNRHLTMIAIGGVIGAGLFVGSSSGIAAAGPGILLSYALVGTLVVLVMRMLGEMSAANPTSGSFSEHADRALGRWAGFSIGWLYWFFWVVVLAVEGTAGAKILSGWVPAVPQWGWALIVMLVLTASNLFSVGSYGEFEFWFAGIKVVAIAAFIIVGLLAIFGVLPGAHTDQASFANLTNHGGFLPHGPGAILTGVLLVVFSFMGSEIATLAAGESEDPQRAVTKATNSIIWRIGVFYLARSSSWSRCCRGTPRRWRRTLVRRRAELPRHRARRPDHERHRADGGAVLSQLRSVHGLPDGLLARPAR